MGQGLNPLDPNRPCGHPIYRIKANKKLSLTILGITLNLGIGLFRNLGGNFEEKSEMGHELLASSKLPRSLFN